MCWEPWRIMPLASFLDMMADAERQGYAVGYFEIWNLESLLAVCDAAEAMRSPVMLGFSGIYLPHPERIVGEPLSLYATLGLEAIRRLSVPACLVFNESPNFEWVVEAVKLGFGLVMFSDNRLTFDRQLECVRQVVDLAHETGVAVEGEAGSLPGVGGELSALPEDLRLTDPDQACHFVERTGVDAFAVNIGQAHLHGRKQVHLNLSRLMDLKQALPVPLVLHGASSVDRLDLKEAIYRGIRKINVGSALKRVYFDAVRQAAMQTSDNYNPYEVIGSGQACDVLTAGRTALQKTVQDWMKLFGSGRE
jgi:fructose-bisphosphate aldolase, class II